MKFFPHLNKALFSLRLATTAYLLAAQASGESRCSCKYKILSMQVSNSWEMSRMRAVSSGSGLRYDKILWEIFTHIFKYGG
jgi:hypothetical protein